MTGIVFIVLAMVELAFASYFIVTTSSQPKAKSYARLIELVVFVALCILNIFEWGMRWYLLGTLLLVLALRAGYVLTLKKKQAVPFRKSKVVLKAIGMLLIYAVVLIPSFLFPQYDVLKQTGEYGVATAEHTFTSDTIADYYSDGNRHVNVGFWYPSSADGKYPLVVFTHGAFGVRNSNLSLYEELASHGYVVCSIDHPGHSFFTKSEDGKATIVDTAYMNEVLEGNTSYYTTAEYFDLIQKWMKIRTEDINLTLDTILQYAKDSDYANDTQAAALYKLIDRDKIGVFGHSMGAAASVQIGRERQEVSAVINIDGPYFSEIVYDANADEFVAAKEQYDTPVLNIYSDQVWVQLRDGTETGVYSGNKISDTICTESYDVYLKGTKHLTLTDLALVSPPLAYLLNGERSSVDVRESIALENRLILEFFDAALKGEGKFSSAGVHEVGS